MYCCQSVSQEMFENFRSLHLFNLEEGQTELLLRNKNILIRTNSTLRMRFQIFIMDVIA